MCDAIKQPAQDAMSFMVICLTALGVKLITKCNNRSALYKTTNGAIELVVRVQSESVWLSQKQIADLLKTTNRLFPDTFTASSRITSES
jgi:hypothetical protein